MTEPVVVHGRMVLDDVEVKKETADKIRLDSSEKTGEGQNAYNNRDHAKMTLDLLKDIKDLNTQSLEGAQRKNAELLKFLSSTSMSIATGLKGILTKSFEVVEMIYKKISAASPLLQAIENLFNLAWSLFFMPIGNKLGELLIPAVLDLMDAVMAFWEEYGDGGLGEMVSGAIHMGVLALADFISDIGDILAEQTGIVGTIGHFLQRLGDFIEDHGEDLVTMVFNLTMFVFENIGTIIALIGTFMSLHYALQLATMAVIAGSNSIAGWLGAGAVIVGATGVALSSAIGAKFNLGEGGYVGATDGGQLVNVAEAGQGEYIVPESKVIPLDQALASRGSNMQRIGGSSGNSYTVNVYSYSTDEIKTIVKEVVSDEISQSRLRSGY